MKKEEVGYLVKEKLNEGKDYSLINKEIKNLKQSQIILKQNKKEINELKKEIKELTEENNKLKTKNFNLGLKLNTEREQIDKQVATVNHLNRVFRIIKLENKPLTLQDLKNICCTTTSIAKECLTFLEKNKMIKKERINGSDKYLI